MGPQHHRLAVLDRQLGQAHQDCQVLQLIHCNCKAGGVPPAALDIFCQRNLLNYHLLMALLLLLTGVCLSVLLTVIPSSQTFYFPNGKFHHTCWL